MSVCSKLTDLLEMRGAPSSHLIYPLPQRELGPRLQIHSTMFMFLPWLNFVARYYVCLRLYFIEDQTGLTIHLKSLSGFPLLKSTVSLSCCMFQAQRRKCCIVPERLSLHKHCQVNQLNFRASTLVQTNQELLRPQLP